MLKYKKKLQVKYKTHNKAKNTTQVMQAVGKIRLVRLRLACLAHR